MIVRKKACFAMTAVLIAGTLSGCSIRKSPEVDTQDTAGQMETQKITEDVSESETIVQTEKPTEKQTEKKLSLKDIQVSIPAGGRSGSISVSVSAGGNSFDDKGSFESSSDTFHCSLSRGEAYGTKDRTVYDIGDGYREAEGSYTDFMDVVRSESCRLEGETEENGRECYHLSATDDDGSGLLSGALCIGGFKDVMCGSTDIEVYAAKENLSLNKVVLSSPFIGKMDGKDIQGTVSLQIDDIQSYNENISVPEAEPETEETDPIEDAYEAGVIDTGSNIYKNQAFGIQISGGSFITFDQSRTDEISETYQNNNSSYSEEAYASSDSGTIVNIQSVSADGETKENILADYLGAARAESIEAGETADAGGLSFAKAKALINGKDSVTYCAEAGNRALIATVYMAGDTDDSSFESSVYSITDDLGWSPESWTVEDKYVVTTPKGYTIDRSSSGSLYAAMSGSDADITVFAIAGSTVEGEAQKESTSSGETTKEQVSKEEISLDSGETMTYEVVHNTERDLEYWSYIGLLAKGDDVLKCYAVSGRSDASFREAFKDILGNISDVESGNISGAETQAAEMESGETSSEQTGTSEQPMVAGTLAQ